MINENGNARYVQLEEELELFSEMGISPVQKLTGTLNSVRLALADLKKEVYNYSFTDPEEEIYFFKHIKPKFLASQIYALERFKIDADKPLGEETILKIYYEQELKFIRRFFEKHQFLYQYYLLDGKELDNVYFIRGINQPSIFIADGPDLDPKFSTTGDYLFARFLAMEKLQEYLMQRLYNPLETENYFKNSRTKGPFKWTGDKSNLIELAYGIYGTMQINDGNITIADIIEWLELSLDISLTRYYRRFSEIKMRKSISKTKYLDDMRDALAKYIDEGDTFKPLPIKPLPKAK